MKFNFNILSTVDFPGVREKILKAGADSLKEVIVLIAHDSKKDSPWLTGNNSRSIDYESKALTGSVFSTSGYGGYLETGTVKRDPRPYMKPALDQHIGKLANNIKGHLK